MPNDKKMLRVLAGETEKTPPVWIMRQAGRYLPEYMKVRATAGGFLDLCYVFVISKSVCAQHILVKFLKLLIIQRDTARFLLLYIIEA